MSKTIERLLEKRHVANIDDERCYGNGYIVVLADNWCFRDDPGCGVRGFDSITEIRKTVKQNNVYRDASI